MISSIRQMDRKQLNVLLLGLCFCLVFTGFNTIGNIQTLIFNSAMDPNSDGYVEGFNGNGLWSLAIIYMVFTVANWISPSVVAFLGPRMTMICGAVVYALFIAQLLVLNTVLLYVASVLLGLGAAIIWTAQGTFLSQNSDKETITRNSGIFWAMSISSGFWGNIFVFFVFQGKDTIDTQTRNIVGISLLSVTALGTVLMLVLRPAPKDKNKDGEEEPAQKQSPLEALKDSAALFITPDMLMLSITFFYSGIQLNIWSAVYGTCIGFTNAFGSERKALASISGIFVAGGEVLGGAVFGIFGKATVKRGRDPIVILGCVLSVIAYFLIFLNLPNNSPLGETGPEDTAFIESNKYLAMATSFLLGFSDACFNTQIFSILGGTFKDKSSSAFAIFKFMQSLSTSIAFWYSPKTPLYWQLLVAVILDVIGTFCFCKVEWKRSKEIEAASDDNSCGVPATNEDNSCDVPEEYKMS